MLIKSFELSPLAKLAVETGSKATIQILNRLEYQTNLCIPKPLNWLGYDRTVTAMDVETAKILRDDSVRSSVIRIANRGTATVYGTKPPEETKIGAASAIGLVEKTEEGNLKITRKKELGHEDKHGGELISEFHNIENPTEPNPLLDKPEQKAEPVELKEERIPAWIETETPPAIRREPFQDVQLKLEQELPALKKEASPSLKTSGAEDYEPPLV